MTKREKSDIINTSRKMKVSATGSNKFKVGFTGKNLDRHWGGSSDHSDEYPGWNKEQYSQRALELVQSATSENVLGYKTSSGAIVRYDKATNDFVKGYPETGVASLYKPEDGEEYFLRR